MDAKQLTTLQNQLTAFLDGMTADLGRADRRRWARAYVRGLLLDGDRKSAGAMAARLAAVDHSARDYEQALQQLVTDSPWADRPVRDRLAAWAAGRAGRGEKLVVVDDTGFPKKGTHSVGVAPQYSGSIGAVGNCQVAVTVQLAAAGAVVCLDAELYLPKVWGDDRRRCPAAGVPAGVGHRPKWLLALGLLEQAKANGETMLAADRLALAIDVHAQSYQLLRWLAEAVRRGFIPATRAHRYANAGDAAFDWMREHYLNLPSGMRPEPRHLREFANFFGTYVTSSFVIVEQPGNRLDSRCGCYCPLCAHLVNAPHLRPKKLRRKDKERAGRLMVDRVAGLAREEGIGATDAAVAAVVQGDETRRPAAYSAYGYWLIRRLDGDTDGPAVLALWREIAWTRTGSPIRGFRLRCGDFVDAEEVVADALRSVAGPESS